MSVQSLPRTEVSAPRQTLGTFVSEVGTLYGRAMKKLFRRPVILYFSLVQPMIWLLLFGQLFERFAQAPQFQEAFGGTSYFQFLVAAVIVQTILFGAGQSGVALISDIDSGFLDKLLTTPINRMAILLGRVFGDLTRMMIQALIILVIAYVFGLFQDQPVTYYYGIPGILGALAIALLFGILLAGLNVFVALKTRNTEATFLISNFLTLPLLFASSAQVPIQVLPDWMQTVALSNPVTYGIDAIRTLLNGPQIAAAAGKSVSEVILQSLVILGVLATITFYLAVRTFRKRVT